ncbi:MAG: amidohydrolase family protein [Senegalia sp. (in: firmicutes)]|uniref:amidohydrolase family protein n=1 Tax=Senegalia sp. (in: firmicutes) TaxID=1924098 RepID=UPI003F9E6A88
MVFNPLVYETRSIRSVVDIVGAEKVLFVSDFPLLIYPRKCRKKEFELFITDIRQNAGLNEEEWTKVMYDNANKLLSQAKRK